MKKHVPQIYLEQLYLKELSSGRTEKISGESTEFLLKVIDESNKDILLQYPPEIMKENILKRMDQNYNNIVRKKGIQSSLLKLVPLAAALVLITLNLSKPGITSQPDSIIRAKGLTPEFSVYLEDGYSPVQLFNDDFVSESDLIQLTYNSAGNRYGVIFSIDGRGVITLHYPQNKNSLPLVEPDGSHALPYAYELDDAPGFERFFFVSSNREFNVDFILGSANKILNRGNAETMETLDLSPGFDQQSILLRKEF